MQPVKFNLSFKLKYISLFLISCSFIAFSSCEKNDISPERKLPAIQNEISDSVRKYYTKDANVLSVRYMQESSDSDKVMIDTYSREVFLKALSAVYKSNHPERDTIFNICKIHTFPLEMKKMLLYFSDQAWNSNWLNNFMDTIIPTGNKEFDPLVQNFHFYFCENGTVINKYPVFMVIESDILLNIEPLANRFEQVNGIITAEPNAFLGDGDDIEYKLKENSLQLIFSKKWGDCPSGCMFERRWVFEIDKEGKVDLLYTDGNNIPENELH
jgi:hypothetical protein